MKRKRSDRKRAKARHKATAVARAKAADLVAAIPGLIQQQQYELAAKACQHILQQKELSTKQKAEVYGYLATAEGMQQNFNRAYKAACRATALDPNDSSLWYNRSLSALLTLRIGHAVRDAEQAEAVNKNPQLTKQISDHLRRCRESAEMALAAREEGFTLDELIEQERLFHQGTELMSQKRLEEAKTAFQQTIAMSDCLPQPWGNIGAILAIEGRLDEAEIALKRALEMEPDYEYALENLAVIEKVRKEGNYIADGMIDLEPLKGQIKIGIKFTEE